MTGKNYVHIINPINGQFEQTNIFSVSVLSKSCFVSDAFATAMMAGNLDYAKKLTKENDEIESMIIYLDDNDELKSFISEGFQKNFLNLLTKRYYSLLLDHISLLMIYPFSVFGQFFQL